ncbi:hypothetical protein DL93DRAFT_2163830 [Clavulina sp. PMI_390]|nr:hypothetical protein DL93DRAFT_2163830 [Clavulina sp. PMI_390]
MDFILNLLPYVFNSGGPNRTPGQQKEFASSYGRFKPTYYPYPWPPRNDDEAQRLYNHIRTVAWYLDAIPYLSQAGLPLRVGVDDIIGAIPFYGDFAGVILAAYMVVLCWIFGTPSDILVRMIINTIIDGLIGIVPFLGDVLDTLFKSNLRNLALLEDWLLKGEHRYNIQVTPSDEFLPRKSSAKAKPKPSGGGFFGFGSSGGSSQNTNGANGSSSATGSAPPPRGTYRFNRADLDTNLDLD